MKRLQGDEKGASAIEFALAAPAMMMFIIGIAQLGMLCMADAGLSTAVAEGARAAAVYPTPDDDAIIARVNEAAWGMQAEHREDPTITRDEDANGNDYLEISMSYSAPLNFVFMDLGPVELTAVRRVFIQGTSSSGGTSSTSASSTSASTSSTSSTSTSSTSTSSTSTSSTSTSSTSSTSTGGTSTTTSGGSTTSSGSSSSTGSTSSASSSSGNGNGNGNGNGHGNGHGHGNGKN
ncbi:MAG: pilus assembly protein [Pseudomonadota bacterium]|nr:pilus assembly protein [Pseudomonadota bacterium]